VKVEVTKSFEKDIRKIKDKKLAKKLSDLINELEVSKTIVDIPNLKKMVAPGSYYRIRVGQFRLGLKIERNIVVLLCFMDRKEIYKYFP